MKHIKKMTVHWKQGFDGADEWNLFCCDMSAYGHVVVDKQAIEFEVPDNWNPVPAQIEMLIAEKKKALDDFNDRVHQINVQLGKLQALTFDAEVSHGQ